MWHRILSVARKELREIVRDRRSLGAALFYAVWGPGVMAIALLALARDRGADPALTLGVEGRERATALMSFLAERSVTVVRVDDAAGAVRAGTLPVALQVDSGYAGAFEEAKPARLALVYDASWSESNARAARVRPLLAEYGKRVGDTRLILRGISPSVVSPLRVTERDLSTAAGRAALVLATLPIFVLLSAFIGGMGVAADLTAGERERGSLESLLLYPVPRATIILGKWIATACVSIATVTLTLAVSLLVLRHPRLQAIDLPMGLSAGDAASMWLILVPLALCASAIQILVALHSRSYKEAQTLLSFLVFLPMVPGFLLAFGSIEASAWVRLTPMTGHHVLIGEVVRGIAPAPAGVAILTLITGATAAMALGYATSLLGRETMVRRLGG